MQMTDDAYERLGLAFQHDSFFLRASRVWS